VRVALDKLNGGRRDSRRPKRLLDDIFTRRMFGGNLAVGWPAAVVTRHYMDGFVDRLRRRARLRGGVRRAGLTPPASPSRVPQG
jgi:hypothetical protein